MPDHRNHQPIHPLRSIADHGPQAPGAPGRPREAVYAREVMRLLESYGTSFDELPHYLQAAVDRIDLAD